MIVTTKRTISMLTGEVLEHKFYEYEGLIDQACGASNEQKDVEKKQNNLLDQMTQQSQQVFGGSSQVFKDLVSSFAPTVAAGPNQKGFSLAEDSALKSGAITNTGQAYKNASTAVKEAGAAIGGGNEYLPGGADIGRNIDVANAGAEHTADALNKIDQANYATGRENYFEAAKGLSGAPDAFNPATTAGNGATSAGEAASQTANQIAQENNSWVGAVTGALGGIGAAAVSGGMSNLGKKASSTG